MNFDRFKMFHLSVLWRAAVSKFKVDQNISLGSHANQLAELIMSGATCPPGDFPFFAVLNVDAVGQPVPTVSPLAKGEVQEDIFDGHDYYMMSYAYCDWTFIVARPGPEWLRILEEQFRRDGIFVLPTTSHKQSKSFALASERLSQQRQQGNSARGIRAGNSTEPDLEFRF